MAKNSSSSSSSCGGGVRVMSRSLVKASVTCSRVVVAVSNLDLLYEDMPASLLCIYRKPATGSFKDVVAAFNAKLPFLLDRFSLLAGRIVADPRSGLPEVHCDNQGAELVLGEVGVALGSLDYGDLEASLARIGVPVPYGADLALSLQLVSFACGGFAVAWCGNHMLMDGSAMSMIVGAWAELAAGTMIPASPPNKAKIKHDGSLVSFRRSWDPRAYYCPSSLEELFVSMSLESEHDEHPVKVRRTYYVEERDLAALRAQAQATGRLEAVSAYLWKVFANVVGSSDVDERCRMGWWVAPAEAAMHKYVTVAEANVEEMKRQALPGIASTVRESINLAAADDEQHFQLEMAGCWVEKPKGKGKGKGKGKDVGGLGSPLLGLGVTPHAAYLTDFGFGQAVLAMPTWTYSSRLCCGGFVTITTTPTPTPPSGGRSCFWLFTMSIWPSLAAALDSHHQRIFRPLTAEYLGIVDAAAAANKRHSRL